MQYLVTYIQDGVRQAWHTHWFEPDNHFNKDLSMIVFDLANGKFMDDGTTWKEITEDHL